MQLRTTREIKVSRSFTGINKEYNVQISFNPKTRKQWHARTKLQKAEEGDRLQAILTPAISRAGFSHPFPPFPTISHSGFFNR